MNNLKVGDLVQVSYNPQGFKIITKGYISSFRNDNCAYVNFITAYVFGGGLKLMGCEVPIECLTKIEY